MVVYITQYWRHIVANWDATADHIKAEAQRLRSEDVDIGDAGQAANCVSQASAKVTAAIQVRMAVASVIDRSARLVRQRENEAESAEEEEE